MPEASLGAVALRRFEAELMEADVEVPVPFAAHEHVGRPRRCAQAEAAALRLRA